MHFMLFCLLLCWSSRLFAQDDDLNEAQGLPDEKPKVETKDGWRLPDGVTERAYLWMNATSEKRARGGWERVTGPDAEASLSLAYKSPSNWQSFIDGRILHSADPVDNQGVLEQGGFRATFRDTLQLMIGKERSRKAPGLILAPSDFLYAQENLPGQREQRTGLWQARISWLESGRSLEAIVLPFDTMQDSGLPDREARWKGWAVRGFYQLSNFDLQASAGHLNDGWHEGLSTQGILGAWKIYAEAGWSEEARSIVRPQTEKGRSTLFGTEYQGWDKWSLRGEVFYQTPAADRQELNQLWTVVQRAPPGTLHPQAWKPFFRHSYGIVSCSALGLDDRINLFMTVIRSLEDRAFLFNQRGEWLLDDHQVIGLAWVGLSEGDRQQYALRPFDRQVSVDWKFTF